jgi:hypothetical protein
VSFITDWIIYSILLYDGFHPGTNCIKSSSQINGSKITMQNILAVHLEKCLKETLSGIPRGIMDHSDNQSPSSLFPPDERYFSVVQEEDELSIYHALLEIEIFLNYQN